MKGVLWIVNQKDSKKELRRLNFGKLISIDSPVIEDYTFETYQNNGNEHSPINGYCISCEENNINLANDDNTFRLTNISHGAHSSDFFLALNGNIDRSGWHEKPIVFVYESPSLDYGIYKEVHYKGYNKHPSKDWYWIHDDNEIVYYPDRFTGGEYGGFVLSCILTFKLKNVYITNLIKCGLNIEIGRFKGLSSYQNKCIENCYNKFLKEEFFILNPAVVFAVGSAVEGWIKYFVKDSFFVQQLPHPAGRRRGFRDEHYKVLYFWLVARALHKAGIIQTGEASQLSKLFLERYE